MRTDCFFYLFFFFFGGGGFVLFVSDCFTSATWIKFLSFPAISGEDFENFPLDGSSYKH